LLPLPNYQFGAFSHSANLGKSSHREFAKIGHWNLSSKDFRIDCRLEYPFLDEKQHLDSKKLIYSQEHLL
jgi:hypothetical protein